MPTGTRSRLTRRTLTRLAALALFAYIGSGGTGPLLARLLNAALWVGIVVTGYTAALAADRGLTGRGWSTGASLLVGLSIAILSGALMLGTSQLLSN